MSDDLQAFALQNAIDEIKKTCPEVSNSFIFNNNGTIIAKNEDIDEETAANAIKIFNAVAKSTDTIGGLESATFFGKDERFNVYKIEDLYMVLVGPEEPGEDVSRNLARILVPTVIRLTQKISNFETTNPPTKNVDSSEDSEAKLEEPGITVDAEEIKPSEHKNSKRKKQAREETETLPEPPVNQLMVENLGRLHTASNFARIDSAVIQQWKDLYGEKEISEVEVETLNGQKIRCNFKLIGDTKLDGKGFVQLPQRIQLILNTSKGELVTVKPII